MRHKRGLGQVLQNVKALFIENIGNAFEKNWWFLNLDSKQCLSDFLFSP